MDRARLFELFDAYLDQRLDEASRAALNAEILGSTETRRLFWEYAQQHALHGPRQGVAAGEKIVGIYGTTDDAIRSIGLLVVEQ